MKKRIISSLLALTFLLTACGGATGENGTDSVPASGSAAESSEAKQTQPPKELSYSGYNPLDYGMTPFDSQVTLKIPVFDRVEEGSPDPADNHYTRWVQENFGDNLNVKVEYVPITRSDTLGSYSMLLAAGTPPTMLMEYDWDKVCLWAGDGAFTPIDIDEFAKTAPTWFERTGGKERFDTYKVGGEYIFAPAYRPNVGLSVDFVIFYRKDWYRKAGLELPTNWEEFANALKTFQDMGFSDGKPIYPMNPFSRNYQITGDYDFPRDEEEWVMHTGVTVPALPTKAAYWNLKKFNHLYNLDVISSEFELSTPEENAANFINGTSYEMGSYIWEAGNNLAAFYENNPDAELGIIGNPSVWWDRANSPNFGTNDIPHGVVGAPVGWYIGFSSKATQEEIKAAWMYLEWMNQPEVLDYMQFGPGEGLTYTVKEDGTRELMNMADMADEYRMFQNNRNKDYWSVVTEGYDVPVEDKVMQDVANLAGIPQDFTQELLDLVAINRAKMEDKIMYPDPIFSKTVDAINEYGGSLESLFIEFATKLVKCAPEEFDALYEQFSKEYLDAGYQAIMDERLQQYKDGYTTKLPATATGEEPYNKRTDYLDVIKGSYNINP